MFMTRLAKWILVGVLVLLAPLSPTGAAAMDSSGLPDEAVTLLKSKQFVDKAQAIRLLADAGGQQAKQILSALLAGRLFYLKQTGQLVYAAEREDGYAIEDVLGEERWGTVKKRAIKKVTVNNKLRSQIRDALAIMDLRNPDAGKRLVAVNQMLDRPDAEHASLLEPILAAETDPRVREAMETVVALAGLSSSDQAQRMAALELLDGNIHPAVRNALRPLRQSTGDRVFAAEIDKTLSRIEGKLQIYSFIENLFFGLSLGSVLVLAAIGLAITFGVMGVINMAHGELIMLGAYTTYVIQLIMPDSTNISVLVAIPAAFAVSGLVGIAIERGVIRFLYGRSLETLLATFGISLVLQQTVRTIFSPLNRSVETPQWMSGVWEVNSALSLTLNRIYIIVFCLLVFAALFIVLKKTSLGLQVRAVSQNRAMARAMGVRSEWVDAMTFGLGSGIAGVAGVALSQLTNVGPNLGQAYIIDSFMVVVFGGVGNLWGTLVGGITLGVANKFLEPWSGAVLAKILVLVFIILFIQKRPRGLFPQKGRAAEG